MTKESVYIGMTVDVLHHGHINIIEQAKQYGKITIGLLTDSAIADHKRLPQLTFEQRRKIVSNISGVHHVVPQEEWNYAPNLLRYRPQFMVHGTDWQNGPLLPYRQLALDALAAYGGQLIEIPYTQGISSQKILDDIKKNGVSVEVRRATLKRCILAKPITRFIEAHNPISALIAESAKVENQGNLREFDGFWSSSLTDSAAKGKPDTEVLTISERLNNINDIFEVTTKPLIFDGDTGGQAPHFALNVKSMERLGISAVIIEDKRGLKRNSLLGNEVAQTQDTIEEFSEKILAGRSARVGDDFMIFARVESLILDKGMNDALTRAAAYVAAGADGIMIHSRKKTAAEVQEFAEHFRKDFANTPLVCVPTSYHLTTENELADSGFNVVIYANHLLRAAYPAMHQAAMGILRHGRSFETDARLLSIDEILKLIPGTSA
jgi:phosphoenolpyruvate phosphomutase / 2-hydroxyethylphosphonate cytidylyltransferase